MPHIEANSEGIRAQFGVKDPRALLKRVAKLAPHEEIVLPDGTVLRGSEVLGASGLRSTESGICEPAYWRCTSV